MNDRGVSLKASIFITVPIALLLVGILIVSIMRGRDSFNLMPALPDPTAVTKGEAQSPATVSFNELNDNPVAYLNQPIIVTGSYLPLKEVQCLRHSGPNFEWSLTADNLQLDASAYERIIRLLPAGTEMTVQGIWRLYQGPLGCGKGPARGNAWYLDVRKILQPNPLIGEGGQVIPIIINGGEQDLPDLIPTLDLESTIPTTTVDSLTVTPNSTEIVQPTIEGQATFTTTPTSTGEILPTGTIQQTATPLAPTGTSVAGPTATNSVMTPVPTDDPNNPVVTNTPNGQPVPPTSTAVPGGGYPGPVDTPVPTPSPDPYL